MRALSLQEVEWVSGGGAEPQSAEATTYISDTPGSAQDAGEVVVSSRLTPADMAANLPGDSSNPAALAGSVLGGAAGAATTSLLTSVANVAKTPTPIGVAAAVASASVGFVATHPNAVAKGDLIYGHPSP